MSDVEGLKILKLSQHPQIILQIEVMKTEVMKYQTLADSINAERKDVKGNDTFDISDWWKTNCAKLPAFTYVLCAVLTSSPNYCPPERLFRIFNSTFDADQKTSYADYSYRYSHSLTLEHSSSGVSRSEGEGEEWVRGFGRLLPVCNYPLSCTCGNPSRKRHMTNKESRFAVNNRLSIT